MSKSSLEHTKEKQDEFLRRFQEGEYSVEKTAELIGLTKRAVYYWKKENPEFCAAVEALQEENNEYKTERIERNIATWAINPTEKVGMVNFLAAMAWLKAHKREKWNEKYMAKTEKGGHQAVSITVKIPTELKNREFVDAIGVREIRRLTDGDESEE